MSDLVPVNGQPEKRLVCYYQSFDTMGFRKLSQIITKSEQQGRPAVDVLIVSSLHFGKNLDGSHYIHLNDQDVNWVRYSEDDPSAPLTNTGPLWPQTHAAHLMGIKVMLMLGGAGGAYEEMFTDFDAYYSLLKDTIKRYPWITGIDLDIETEGSIENMTDKVENLIQKIWSDFGPNFTITMAPIAPALQVNGPDSYGVDYKKLYESVGQKISWFNVQFYPYLGGFNVANYNAVLENGYPSSKVVMGMLAGGTDVSTAAEIVHTIVHTDPEKQFGGAGVWELGIVDDLIGQRGWISSMWSAMYDTSQDTSTRQDAQTRVPEHKNDCTCCVIQ